MTDYDALLWVMPFKNQPYTTFTNDDGDMVIRVDYEDDNYAEFICNEAGEHIKDVFAFNGKVTTYIFAE